MKNKPHPRWAAGSTHNSDDAQPGVDSASANLSSPPASPTQTSMATDGDAHPHHATPKTPISKGTSRSGASASKKPLLSPIDPTGLNLSSLAPPTLPAADLQFSDFLDHSALGADNMAAVLMSSHSSSPDIAEGDLQNIFDCLVQVENPDGFWPLNVCTGNGAHEHCGCLEDPASYHTILELSLRLRKASDTLNRFSKHGTGVSCAINQSISELDRFTSCVILSHCCLRRLIGPPTQFRNVLGNVITPPSPDSFMSSPVGSSTAGFSGTPSPTYPTAPYGTPNNHLSMSGTTPNLASANSLSPRSWGFKSAAYPSPPYEDSFMSWEPQRY